MDSKWYKTAGGEKYGKCGLTFAADAVEVPAGKLDEKRGDLGLTVGERLAMDERLVEVPPPEKPHAAKPDSVDPAKDDKGEGEDKGGKAGKGK